MAFETFIAAEPEETSQRVTRLMAMGQEELAATWRRHCRGKAPVGLPRSLLARVLAHRIQAEVFGDLSAESRRFLDKLGKDVAMGKSSSVKSSDSPSLKPGTILVREHDGAEHRVMVLADGYAWNGQVHGSLSAVATAITGTRWNGRRFFGLDGPLRAKRKQDPSGACAPPAEPVDREAAGPAPISCPGRPK